MPSMPGSGTWVPPLVVEPPLVVLPPLDEEELLELEELELLELLELVEPEQYHLQLPPLLPPHQKVADAGVATSAAEARLAAMSAFFNISNPPKRQKSKVTE